MGTTGATNALLERKAEKTVLFTRMTDPELLDGNDQVELQRGDIFVMKTPGGRGFGKANL